MKPADNGMILPIRQVLRLHRSDARCLRASADPEQACGSAQSGGHDSGGTSVYRL